MLLRGVRHRVGNGEFAVKDFQVLPSPLWRRQLFAARSLSVCCPLALCLLPLALGLLPLALCLLPLALCVAARSLCCRSLSVFAARSLFVAARCVLLPLCLRSCSLFTLLLSACVAALCFALQPAVCVAALWLRCCSLSALLLAVCVANFFKVPERRSVLFRPLQYFPVA